ncbi:MAG TPA: flagellar basal body L-ring protein FlgH [Alphaproteobacteria bacterium]|jgi:flagellar L-ring protein precursor FlgH|nr:flagellar basal body L-ring protein FlgH [Alphaproteobacteria bacterium]
MTFASTAFRAGIVLTAFAASGCNMLTRLSEVGDAPKLTTIQNPTMAPNYQPVTMPMPAPVVAERQPSSLWRPGARDFLKDQRASNVGDIVTVVVDLNDQAKFDNETKRGRDVSEDAGLTNFMGFEQGLKKVLPEGLSNTSLVKGSSKSAVDGSGSVDRKEQITVRVAAVVTQVLPNGNLVLQGRQEMRVNFEVRDLQVAGIIRPQDISSTNTIKYDQIAEARIAYGGRGQISDVQQPRYGEQMFDIIFPF